MCLIIKKNSRLKVASEDIIVYKRVRLNYLPALRAIGVSEDGNAVRGEKYTITAGVRKFRYHFGKTYTTTLGVEVASNGQRTVERGFHSFPTVNAANKDSGYGPYLVKCVIPKGSLYYEGSNNGDCNGIASDAIRLVSFHKE